MKKKRKKPTGETLVTHVAAGPDGVMLKCSVLKYPEVKEDVERFIAEKFLATCAAKGHLPYTVSELRQNVQDDLDFTLATATGDRYLELMELAPFHGVKGGFSQAPARYSPFGVAREIVDKLLSKSARYVAVPNKPIDVLVYVTHWAFVPSEVCVALMQYWLCLSSHRFCYVFLYCPITEHDGIHYRLFPTPMEHWHGFDPLEYRESVVQCLSPAGWRIGDSGSA